MMTEAQVIYENGDFWIHRDKQQSAYVVYRNGVTHAVSDSTYKLDADGLSIAKARVDYLARRLASIQTRA